MWHRLDERAISEHLDDCYFLVGLNDGFFEFAVCASLFFVEVGKDVLTIGIEEIVEACMVGINVKQ